MLQPLIDLYTHHVARALDHQLRLAEYLDSAAPNQPWALTISTATLSFGNDLHFAGLYLGSHADPDDTWLWAWCNSSLTLAPANQELAAAVEALAARHGVSPMAAAHRFPCLPLFGPELAGLSDHVFAMIISRELGFDAYYSAPFPHGRGAVLIRDPRLRIAPEFLIARIASVFPQVISAMPVFNQQAAFASYAASYGLVVEQAPARVRVSQPDGSSIDASFDGENRLITLDARLHPAAPQQ